MRANKTKIKANLTDFRLFLESLALSDVAHKPATETYNTRNQVSEAKTKYVITHSTVERQEHRISKISVKN